MIARLVSFTAAICIGIFFLFSTLGAAPAQASFGLEKFDVTFTNADGSPATQAGSHPFQMTTSVFFNRLDHLTPDQEFKDGVFEQIVGLIADPTAVPRCSVIDFLSKEGPEHNSTCPDSTAVGYAATEVTLIKAYSPIFNLDPPPGAVLKLGFIASNTPVTIEVVLRKNSPYNGSAVVTDLPQTSGILASVLTLWGNPADPAHDPYRGICVSSNKLPTTVQVIPSGPYPKPPSYGNCPTSAPSVPLLTLPRACQGPLSTSYAIDSWQQPGARLPDGDPDLADPDWASGSLTIHDGAEPPDPQGMTGCDTLGFAPTIAAQPTTAAAESPSGLSFNLDIDDPGLTRPEGRADSDLEKAVVTLPEGVTTNPSVAAGLTGCSLAEYRSETLESATGTGCAETSKVGTVEVETPVLEGTILPGAIYVAKQTENEFDSLLNIYMVIKEPRLGILVRVAGKVEPNPNTGQLTTTFDNLPQLPFSHFRLHFREGRRAPLITPATCGTYTTEADLYPYADPDVPLHQTADFTIGAGAGNRPCASDPTQLPNAPSFSAGTLSPVAGAYSPFVLKLARPDGSQQLSQISTTLPKGLLGRLTGIPYCSEAQIAQAVARSGEGQGAAELASPSCPAATEVGTVNVGAGAGPEPYYVRGHAYLAGPYKGAPLSLEVVTPAIAGPFDLGVVAVRTALRVDPVTAQIDAVSDPIPSILHGLPLDVRSIALDMSRPDFTLNPTGCEPKSILGSATSPLGSVASLTQYFQATHCAALKFRPSLKLKLKGSTRHAGHPALTAVLTYPKRGAYANIARAQVNLPHSEFLDQGNLNKVCTQPELKAAACPASSVYGKVKAWTPLLEKPLEGKVYLGVGFGYKLPALVAELDGQIRVLLVGKVDSGKNKGIRNTFEGVPDAAVSRFVLELKGGNKYGLLENSENLCAKRQRAIARFTAQNGRVETLKPTIANACGKDKRKSGKGSGRHSA